MKALKKVSLSTWALILAFIIGLCVLLYPTVSDYINSIHQTRAVAGYQEAVKELDEEDYKEMWAAAADFNKELAESGNTLKLTEQQKEEYMKLLDPAGTGMMGYLEIESIDVDLPFYHGTEDTVLQVGAGHLEGSSLPVGGESTHCVLSGHRGLPSATLLSDLDKLEEGDIFLLHVLDQTLAYEVDQIRIVLPEETDDLKIEQGKDYCTLVTCTPYGVNTHRLLVRGHRVDYTEPLADNVGEDAVQIDPVLVAPVLAAPLLLILLILLIVNPFQKRRRKKTQSTRRGKDNE